ncbi:MAG: class I SAM-dependent methyltransferase [Roseibium sp.]|uniref:class I SAM-dependent methyltransferase n=1 Tax=Roseibium sp. TaxID=1936156 RepID=UPI002605A8BD|nr:class I SAM-dependent methyltransferase [Roseibium sp.]MCV0423839.1 class I SAM-dependent methyltransferase [Roseibium sp.]
MDQFPEAHKPGYAIYSKTSLAIYDTLVLGLSNRFIWRCPSQYLTALYNRKLTDNHLDIGVGTGYFLDKATFPVAAPKVTLMDPNNECLEKAAGRIARYNPTRVKADALVPWPGTLGAFGSIGVNYVLHCLPGTMADKAVLFDCLKPHLAEEGTVFGSTILQGDVPRSAFARKLMKIYNGKGVFSNENDTRESLETELSHRFKNVDIEMMGCVALFSASEPV